MIKLLPYLEKRAQGVYSQTPHPHIQGINASEQQLVLACQSTDRITALRIFCRNHPWRHLENEQRQLLLDYILPEPVLLEKENLLRIASAPLLDYDWDAFAEIYVNIETGETFDTSQDTPCADVRAYLNYRRTYLSGFPK